MPIKYKDVIVYKPVKGFDPFNSYQKSFENLRN